MSIEHRIHAPGGLALRGASRKAFFLTSMPFYWFFLFRYVLNWFDLKWFLLVVVLSAVLSLTGKGWGILQLH